MTNLRKRILSLTLVLAMAFMLEIPALDVSAAEVSDDVEWTGSYTASVASPRYTDYSIGLYSEMSSKSEQRSNFTVLSAMSPAEIRIDVSTSAPCVMYFAIYSSSGEMLGIMTFQMTRAGSGTVVANPTTLSSGNYSYGFWFDTDSAYVTLNIYARHY